MPEEAITAIEPANWFRLDGEVGVVTGAGSGIGRVIAQTLAAVGMAVIVVDVSREAAEATTRSITATHGKAAAVVADLGEPSAGETAIAAALELFGSIDVLVNNAGVYRPAGRLPDIDWGLFERTALVNLSGPLRCTVAAARHMVAGGRIINISSMESLRPSGPGLANYACTKAALNALTRQSSVDLAECGIRVNAILPGLIRTEGTAAAGGFFAIVAARAPSRRAGEVADIAGAALFLASQASAYVNGQCLVVDGGMTITG